jgi:hypothetical protein
MNGFKYFFEQTTEQEENIKKTLSKIPKKHSALIKGYKIKWQCDNVLDGDDGHVGVIDPNNKTITIAAPYRFSREHVFLHELAHKIWAHFMTPELVKKWKIVLKNTKNKPNQNAEELWCHSYATYYSKNRVEKFNIPTWMKFIEKLK